MHLTDLIYPPFIYKNCVIAAFFIIILIIIASAFMLSSSEKKLQDINHDGQIDWTELYVAWKLPGTVHWWKYVFGILFASWAVAVSHRIYVYDKKINSQKNADAAN